MTELTAVRLDVWLNAACLFKTRSQAKNACNRGRVWVNGREAKPHSLVRTGDQIEFQQRDWRRVFIIRELRERPIARKLASQLYADESPPRPRLDPLERALATPPAKRERGSGRPSKKQRRLIQKLRGN